jgi:hypothetical protein
MTSSVSRSWAVALAFVVAAAGCGDDEHAPASLSLPTPQALTTCATSDVALQSRLWVSGFNESFALDVDLIGGTTSGTVRVPPGIARRFTIDWFIDADGRTVLLAQASRELDLSKTTDDAVELTFADDDLTTTTCRAIDDGTTNGSTTVDVDGDARPVCDLDDDGTPNVDEVCAGLDPLGGP